MVVKGVVDYADSHKNKAWRLYPAARAALCTKTIIELMDFGKLQVGRLQVEHVAATSSPLSTVPFSRDPEYIHRGPLVDQIHEKLSGPAARVALVGLGGAGKSQLAIEYAYRVREKSPNTWVLWIYASSVARFEVSVRDALEQLKVPGRSEPKANVFQLFRSWLRDTKHGRWLIILDNADNAAFLVKPPPAHRPTQDESQRAEFGEPCIDYLPACSHGSLLATTRSGAAALKIVDQKSIVRVERMNEEHAVALIEKKLGGEYEREEVIRLARAVDFMPLAMTQAAAYIRQRAPRCSVQQYTEKLEKNDKSSLSLLNRQGEDLRRDREASNSIILTWEISFEHIHEIRPSAADLLSLMSIFDRQAIPEALLRERGAHVAESRRGSSREGVRGDGNSIDADSTNDLDSSSSNDGISDVSDAEADEFEEDIAVLRSYSFISITTNVVVFEMHRLVQLATQRWLKLYGRLESWKSQFISNLDNAFPAGTFDNWAKCQPLFPHTMVALEMKLLEREAILRQASLLHKSGWYTSETGAYSDGAKMAMRSFNSRKRVLGKEHPSTLTSMANLASTYSDQGKSKEAAELSEQVLVVRKRVLGEEHPSTLTSMANLARTYADQGKSKEAAELEKQVLVVRKRVLGEEHPDTLTSMANLSFTIRDLGRRKSSLSLMTVYAAMSCETLGVNHPDTINRRQCVEDWAEDDRATGSDEPIATGNDPVDIKL
ncbi:hypothetical protein LTR17_024732 [Elasticomyces elasticus]|nr:hypothetical protein LTR17_024732 [Elasticomyces elasticus]